MEQNSPKPLRAGPTNSELGADADVNESLDDVLELLWHQVERLKVGLEHCRLTEHPNRQAMIRWHVEQIDERQARIDEVQQMILHNKEVH